MDPSGLLDFCELGTSAVVTSGDLCVFYFLFAFQKENLERSP